MGVYNPLIDMPVSCADCFTRGGSNCYLDREMLYPAILKTRHHDCPLVEVKVPHGRLIDADAVYDAVERRYRVSSGAEHRAERDFLDLISDAPIVLEAEGKDDG